ncbi:amidohydrolase [Bacillus cereus BDRD-ST26]|nr:amidohydrolase [Bacillus cereus BDRD-ST26]
MKDKKEAQFDCIYRSLFLSFRKRLFYVKIKGGRKMGATGVASQRKKLKRVSKEIRKST